jgi:octaprenyl-diphosphate synthase
MTPPGALIDRWISETRDPGLASLGRSVKADLEEVERRLEGWARSGNPVTAEVSRYVLQKRGKRLRPALVLLSSRLFSGPAEEGVFLASLFELVHTASLIHDDIIDNAGTRHGGESVHAKWGPNITVLLGDHLYIRSIGLALQSRHEGIVRLLAEVSAAMIEGELDEYGLGGDLDISEARYLSVIEKKTAVMFAGCCRVGAILGGGGVEDERALAEYGRHLGLSFQIVDDLLDFNGSEALLGKPVLSDLAEGRVTLPVIRALAADGGAHRAGIAALLRRRDLGPADKAWLRDVLGASGAFAYANEKALEFADKAVSFLDRFPACPPREALGRIARFVVARNR